MAVDVAVAPGPERVVPRVWLPVLFGVTAFLGAGLLFVVQPLVARLLLPAYGGSATVWSTSSLFFQVLLLVGYLYAHWSTVLLGSKRQPLLHGAVLLLPLLALPVALPADAVPDADRSPVLWLLWTLALMIGLPFAVVSTTGPLLQRWYSWTSGPGSDDPYFLFAASNVGSFGGLLAYPFLIEPFVSLDTQRLAWSAGFVVFVLLTATCALVARRDSVGADVSREPEVRTPLARGRMLRWMWWSFLPSGLMLAITAHIATDVASLPLLWVVPLAIYLATFVAAFSVRARGTSGTASRAAVAVTYVLAIASLGSAFSMNVAFSVGIAMLALALTGFAAHRRLANDRPEPVHLTTYYVVIAVGGALGGLVNGMLAPLVLDRVLEYPLLLAVTPLLVLGLPREVTCLDRFVSRNQLAWAGILVGLATATAVPIATEGLGGGLPLVTLLAGGTLTGLIVFRTLTRPAVMVIGLVLLGGVPLVYAQVGALHQSRTFYGSYRVLGTDDSHYLIHGTTVHGSQLLGERSMEPTTYYERSGPLGDIFRTLDHRRTVIVGLGAGGIAAYSEADTHMTYIEIDPEVERIARDPDLFTYLRDAQGKVDVEIGDGRLKMAEEPDGSVNLMILDAFSSDAIPVHLLTQDAIETYTDKLDSNGVLVVHISNRIFDLRPVLAGAAEGLGLSAEFGSADAEGDRAASEWVALAKDPENLEALDALPQWRPLDVDPVEWTDDRASILQVFR